MRVGYCLNAEEYEKFRLTREGEWRRCENSSTLLSKDYVSIHCAELVRLQRSIDKVIIGEVEKAVGAQWNSPFDDYLDFNVYAFREEYPDPPDRLQLEEVLKKRDKYKTTILILKIDGRFELCSPASIRTGIIDPNVILQYDAYYFNNGNGYAHNLPKRKSFADYVDDIYSTGVFYWKEHLLTKTLHYTPGSFKVYTLDQLLDVFAELNRIKGGWESDFKDYDNHSFKNMV